MVINRLPTLEERTLSLYKKKYFELEEEYMSLTALHNSMTASMSADLWELRWQVLELEAAVRMREAENRMLQRKLDEV